MPTPILVLCLGNDVLSDDGFGPEVARRLKQSESDSDQVEVLYAPVAGFSLISLLENRRCALIVDAIQSGNKPGTLRMFSAGEFTPSRNLTTSHQISLPTALGLGEKLGCRMPEHIDVLTVEASDVETLHEGLTHHVAAAVPKAVSEIRRWLSDQCKEVCHAGTIAG